MREVVDSELGGLPKGVRSRYVEDVNGLRMHILESGFEDPGRPCVLLLHGFPELGYSWRMVMQLLAEQGFHAVAPDQRGFGRTTGWSSDYDGALAPFHILNLVRDAVALVEALGRDPVAAVIGHDFGSPVAAYCALTRPEVFHAVAMMSSPFGGPPDRASGANADPKDRQAADMDQQLAALSPPRKHYQRYFGTRQANGDMLNGNQGLSAFLRAYFHCKSADWAGNAPSALRSWSADELARMPAYYIMDLHAGMAETVAALVPSDAVAATCNWLPDEDLQFYVQEYARTGFQGGLQWYRCIFSWDQDKELSAYHGQSIDVPACFIAGEKDWGVYQKPGALEAMQSTACSQLKSVDLVRGAGHWVQQEQSGEVARLLIVFLRGCVGPQVLCRSG